jgi:hypothetical protein
VSTFVTGRPRHGQHTKNGLYTIVLHGIIAFLTARNKPNCLSGFLTGVASIHSPTAKEWLQVPLAVELFISGTVIAFNLLSTEKEKKHTSVEDVPAD